MAIRRFSLAGRFKLMESNKIMHAGLVSTLETPWQAFLKSSDGMWSSLTENKPHPGQISHLCLKMCFHSLKPSLTSLCPIFMLTSVSITRGLLRKARSANCDSQLIIRVQNRWGLVLKSTRCHHLSHLQTLQGRDLFSSPVLFILRPLLKPNPAVESSQIFWSVEQIKLLLSFFFFFVFWSNYFEWKQHSPMLTKS